MDAFVLRLFLRVWSAKPEDPQFEPMAEDAITWGGIRGLGSPLYICGSSKNKLFVEHSQI